MWQAMAAQAAGSLLGGYLGGKEAKKGAQAAADAQSRALAEARKLVEELQIPSEDALKLVLQQPEYQNLDLDATLIGDTALKDVKEDALSSSIRRKALLDMMDRADKGLTPVELDMARQISDQQAARNTSAMKQQLAQAAAQGTATSGIAAMQNLLASQANAQTASDQSRNLLSQAYASRQQALENAAKEAASQQAYARSGQEKLGESRDRIAQMNAQFTNQGKLNKATFQDRRAENMANVANRQAEYNAEIPKWIYGQQLGKVNALTGNVMGQGNVAANLEQQKAAGKAAMWQGLGQAAGSAAGSYAQSQLSAPQTSSQFSLNNAPIQSASSIYDEVPAKKNYWEA